uniref:DOMON domain-containing protein n=1 Tax=Brugia timori TaxID=42155 RepID=A0A0R3RA81_9BILA
LKRNCLVRCIKTAADQWLLIGFIHDNSEHFDYNFFL